MSGARATAPTSRRPGSSPRPPSTPATSCERGRTARPARTCPRARWWPSPAAGTCATPAPSSPASTRRRRSTTTWCSCTAAGPAWSASPRSGQNGTRCIRWCASRTGTAHGRAAPFRRNDELLSLLPKGVLAFPGGGITDNLVDKAVKLGIPVACCGEREPHRTPRVASLRRRGPPSLSLVGAQTRPPHGSPSRRAGACGAALRGGSAARPPHRVTHLAVHHARHVRILRVAQGDTTTKCCQHRRRCRCRFGRRCRSRCCPC